MSWSQPFTFTSGAVLTAAQLNVYQSGNLNETAPGIVTTAGDLLYASGVNKLARLAAGTDGSLLKYDTATSAPVWDPDATLLVVQSGQNGSTSGSLTRNDWTTHVTDTFTLPDGWVSAEVNAFGSVGATQSDDNQTLFVRAEIGADTGKELDGGELSINHDMSVTGSHSATVTETTVVGMASKITGAGIGSLTFANAQVGWLAVRKS